NAEGQYVWPGYGENSRVLKWICDRLDDKAGARKTPIGLLPAAGEIDTTGLDIKPEAMDLLLDLHPALWAEKPSLIPPAYEKFGARLPKALWDEHAALAERLEAARDKAAAE